MKRNLLWIMVLLFLPVLIAGASNRKEPFDHSFLTFEEVFQNSVEPELLHSKYSPTSPAFKIAYFPSPEETSNPGQDFIFSIPGMH